MDRAGTPHTSPLLTLLQSALRLRRWYTQHLLLQARLHPEANQVTMDPRVTAASREAMASQGTMDSQAADTQAASSLAVALSLLQVVIAQLKPLSPRRPEPAAQLRQQSHQPSL